MNEFPEVVLKNISINVNTHKQTKQLDSSLVLPPEVVETTPNVLSTPLPIEQPIQIVPDNDDKSKNKSIFWWIGAGIFTLFMLGGGGNSNQSVYNYTTHDRITWRR